MGLWQETYSPLPLQYDVVLSELESGRFDLACEMALIGV